MSFTRFAIYYLPPDGDLARFGASWLGWDVATGTAATQPDLPSLGDITMTPAKYGFHGTLKPPFRLSDGETEATLSNAVAQMASTCPPTQCDGLALTALGRFLALTPTGETGAIDEVAARAVKDLDGFRAPASEAELSRRRKAGLSPRQDDLLVQWGYPYVLDEFHFHLTLTDRLAKGELPLWRERVAALLPPLPGPFVLDEVALVGEREDGRFQLVHRYALTG